MGTQFDDREPQGTGVLPEGLVDINQDAPSPDVESKPAKSGRRKLSDIESKAAPEEDALEKCAEADAPTSVPPTPAKAGRARLTETAQTQVGSDDPLHEATRPRLAGSGGEEPEQQQAEAKSARPRLSATPPTQAEQPQPRTKPARARLTCQEGAPPSVEPSSQVARPRLSETQQQAMTSLNGPASPSPGRSQSEQGQPRAQVKQLIAELQAAQNLPVAVVTGLLASVVGAIVWAVVSAATGFRIGYMALAVGFLVGGSVRVFGRGFDRRFGYLGAGLALFGCLLGNFLALCTVAAYGAQVSVLALLAHVSLADVLAVMLQGFRPLGLLFYAIAVYEGYRFSFRRLKDGQLAQPPVSASSSSEPRTT
mgnify:CR=1 FL=1